MQKDPLSIRLYFTPALYELARLVGYAGLPLPEAREKAQALAEKHGRQAMEAADRELLTIDESTNPPTVRLKPEVRKCCFQLLGPPPEHPEHDFLRHGPPLMSPHDLERWKKEWAVKKAGESVVEPPPEKPKKTRRKKAK